MKSDANKGAKVVQNKVEARREFVPPVLKKHKDLPVITAGSIHIYECTKYFQC